MTYKTIKQLIPGGDWYAEFADSEGADCVTPVVCWAVVAVEVEGPDDLEDCVVPMGDEGGYIDFLEESLTGELSIRGFLRSDDPRCVRIRTKMNEAERRSNDADS